MLEVSDQISPVGLISFYLYFTHLETVLLVDDASSRNLPWVIDGDLDPCPIYLVISSREPLRTINLQDIRNSTDDLLSAQLSDLYHFPNLDALWLTGISASILGSSLMCELQSYRSLL